MDTWKLLLITLLSAVVLGCLIGVLTGKHQLKKARGDYKPLLNTKERIIYSLCIVLGAACILFGIFAVPGAAGGDDGMAVDDYGDPVMLGGMGTLEENGAPEVERAIPQEDGVDEGFASEGAGGIVVEGDGGGVETSEDDTAPEDAPAGGQVVVIE